MPQTVPNRVSSTSPTIWLSSADQNETPAAFAPCSTMPAAPLTRPIATTISSDLAQPLRERLRGLAPLRRLRPRPRASARS